MKKLLSIILAFLPCLSMAQTLPVVMRDTNSPNALVSSGITVNTNTSVTALPGGLTIPSGTVTITPNANPDRFLGSDASGVATWTPPANVLFVTNKFMTAEVTSTAANTFYDLLSVTLIKTNGVIILNAQAHVKSKDSTICGAQAARLLRISGNVPPLTTNIAVDVSSMGGSESGQPLNSTWVGEISSTNTFVLQGATDVASAQLAWGGTSKDYYFPTAGVGVGSTNSTSLSILYIPK
jgi:hypothetical protein